MDSSFDPRSITPAELVKTYINNMADLLYTSDRLLPGDRIGVFFALAANRPEVSFRAFLTVLQSTSDPNYRALALRGLGEIIHPELLQEIRACETEDTQELLRMLAGELLGKGQYSNDLTRWAAADALKKLDYPPSILRNAAFGGLMESPERIQREITDRWLAQKDRVQRFDSQGQPTVEYERYLDFWTFGPAQRLFQENHLNENDIHQIIENLSVYGLICIFKDSKINESIQKKFAYPKLKQLANAYLSEPENLWLKNSLESFIKYDYRSQTHLTQLAQILGFQHFEKSLDLNNETIETLRSEINQSNRKLQEFEEIQNTIQRLAEFGSVGKLCTDEYIQYSWREKNWISRVETKIRELLELSEILAFNNELLADYMATLRLSNYPALRNLTSSSLILDYSSKGVTYSLAMSQYQSLNESKQVIQKQVGSLCQSDRIKNLKSEISSLEESGKQYGVYSISCLAMAILADVIAAILIWVVVIAILVASALSYGG
jgi:hypothetical protein